MASPLEPLHPDGRLDRIAVVGSACPAGLVPDGGTQSNDDLDCLIVAPSAEEWRENVQLERRVREAVNRLTPDGIVYALAPPRRRSRIRRLLRVSGLDVAVQLIHVPDTESGRYLVPLERRSGRYAFSCVVPVWRYRQLLLRAALGSRVGRAIVAHVLGPLALVGRSPAGRPLYEWLADGFGPAGRIVTARRGRHPEDRLTLLFFDEDSSAPSRVVKLGDGGVDRRREGAALEALGAAARAAGAAVPDVVAWARVGSWSVLTETAVPGRSAAARLGARPSILPDLLDQLAGWLEAWNLTTCDWAERAEPILNRHIVEPLQELEPVLIREYRDWILARKEAISGSRLCTVAAHNDLTMFNVLVGRNRTLGIVDWEEATGQALPLMDLAYAAVDAVAAAGRYRDRVEAFHAAYGRAGRHRERINALTERLAAGLRLPAGLVELSFHACWLLHARNELRERGVDARGPFVQIVQQVMRMRAGA